MLLLALLVAWSVALTLGFPASGMVSSDQHAPTSPVSLPITKRVQHFHIANSTIVDFHKFSGHLAHLHTKYSRAFTNFRTNTGLAHPLQSRALTPLEKEQLVRATGSVSLTDFQDFIWVGTIAFGQPAQSMLVDFDTGSADTLVNPGAYRPEASSTSVRTSRRFSTAYGDGTSADGFVYRDTVQIGGLRAPSAAIGLADLQFLDPTREGGNQGISGMAFQNISAFNLPGFFDSLRSAGVLSNPIFTFRLAETGSSLTLGGYNRADISGSVTWLPVDPSNGFWVVPGQVNGFGPIASTIIDTGTTAIVAPVADALTLFRNLGMQVRRQSQQVYGAFQCSSPPAVTFTYGGKRVTLTGSSQTLGTDTDGSCISTIVGQDGVGAWVVGDAFLRNTISIFDKGRNRFGLATPAR
ncbi:unnamed protein product [Tilletia controversa]|uniref:Peptidase A1 domain-containing protein n=1 Tax=Tilletia controversa TaxID=13291 RepID=A0A8X7MW09_9BASI|nr:hypothetical protein CF336_g1887 [Tilletia laevis]KAE8203087.1 hypothetical protein CF328_g1847 [Tilletia controversa]CAD7067773.1 unnamed protein product [Tilletia caries]KAE8252231.1 hypothetical protein A4X06_0g2334 [Tilletia controversa]CAD6932515.1 unnamed protein product [Tilletia controversa]